MEKKQTLSAVGKEKFFHKSAAAKTRLPRALPGFSTKKLPTTSVTKHKILSFLKEKTDFSEEPL